MIKRMTQVEVECNGRVVPDEPQNTKIKKPFRVTRKTDPENAVESETTAERRVRLSVDLPHSTYIALYTYSATVQRRINMIVNELILANCTT